MSIEDMESLLEKTEAAQGNEYPQKYVEEDVSSEANHPFAHKKKEKINKN